MPYSVGDKRRVNIGVVSIKTPLSSTPDAVYQTEAFAGTERVYALFVLVCKLKILLFLDILPHNFLNI